MYLIIKHLHITCVALTFLSFFVRGIGMLQDATWLQRRWVKILPHLIDTALLCSGIALAIAIQQYPMVYSWLTAKFFSLLLYIILGSIALKYGKTKPIRTFAWLAALCVFFYIVSVARTRLINPLEWM